MTWPEHLQHLDNVLETIKSAGFKLRLSKCKFAQSQIKLLGQIVGEQRTEGRSPEGRSSTKDPTSDVQERNPELPRSAQLLSELCSRTVEASAVFDGVDEG